MTTPLPDLLRRDSDASMDWVERVIRHHRCRPDGHLIARTVDDLLGVAVDGGVFFGASAGCVLGFASPMAGRLS